MLRNNWLPIKSLIVASSWSHFYLLIKDARSFEYKVSYGVSVLTDSTLYRRSRNLLFVEITAVNKQIHKTLPTNGLVP